MQRHRFVRTLYGEKLLLEAEENMRNAEYSQGAREQERAGTATPVHDDPNLSAASVAEQQNRSLRQQREIEASLPNVLV